MRAGDPRAAAAQRPRLRLRRALPPLLRHLRPREGPRRLRAVGRGGGGRPQHRPHHKPVHGEQPRRQLDADGDAGQTPPSLEADRGRAAAPAPNGPPTTRSPRSTSPPPTGAPASTPPPTTRRRPRGRAPTPPTSTASTASAAPRQRRAARRGRRRRVATTSRGGRRRARRSPPPRAPCCSQRCCRSRRANSRRRAGRRESPLYNRVNECDDGRAYNYSSVLVPAARSRKPPKAALSAAFASACARLAYSYCSRASRFFGSSLHAASRSATASAWRPSSPCATPRRYSALTLAASTASARPQRSAAGRPLAELEPALRRVEQAREQRALRLRLAARRAVQVPAPSANLNFCRLPLGRLEELGALRAHLLRVRQPLGAAHVLLVLLLPPGAARSRRSAAPRPLGSWAAASPPSRTRARNCGPPPSRPAAFWRRRCPTQRSRCRRRA